MPFLNENNSTLDLKKINGSLVLIVKFPFVLLNKWVFFLQKLFNIYSFFKKYLSKTQGLRLLYFS